MDTSQYLTTSSMSFRKYNSDCGSFRVCGEGLQNQVLLDICGTNGTLEM
uniref:Uncharacterized protein n=1 Tax=Trichinella nativa TaxID=6335 RepID=A0A0V1KK19_9BILA